ncbi:MAG TPA: hypothetical protein VI198_02220 [Candidatus Eisenbacteria bacterium]
MLACLALVGCNSDAIHGRQAFFPGSTLTSWAACDKFSGISDVIQICASTGLLPGATRQSYNISFSLPNDAHVLIAVFDRHAALVKVLIDADETATLPGFFRQPPIAWDFTDAKGVRVPPGAYRLYFKSGEFQSTSDLEVP